MKVAIDSTSMVRTQHILPTILALVFFHCSTSYSQNNSIVTLSDESEATYALPNLQDLGLNNKYLKNLSRHLKKSSKRLDREHRKTFRAFSMIESKQSRDLCRQNAALTDYIFRFNFDINYKLRKSIYRERNNVINKKWYDNYLGIYITAEFYGNEIDNDVLDSYYTQLSLLELHYAEAQYLKSFIDLRSTNYRPIIAQEYKSKQVAKAQKVAKKYDESMLNIEEQLSKPYDKNSPLSYYVARDPIVRKLQKKLNKKYSLFGTPSQFTDINNTQSNNSVAENFVKDIQKTDLDWFADSASNSTDLFIDRLNKMAKESKDEFLKELHSKNQPSSLSKITGKADFHFSIRPQYNSTHIPNGLVLAGGISYPMTKRLHLGTNVNSIYNARNVFQGLNLRFNGGGAGASISYQINKIVFVTSSYERNFYNKVDLENINASSQSYTKDNVLLGLAMRLSSSAGPGVKTEILYDFLHNQSIPFTQPVIVRVGWFF